MRRISGTKLPTLLLCVSIAIQIVGSFLLWLFDLPPASNAFAAGPPTTISGTPAGVGGLNTLVNSSPTTVCSANCVVTGGTRPGGGANLFHSFGQFNIGAGDLATFQNGISFNTNGTALPAGLPTSNILARITGTNGNNPTLSSIYGTLQTSGFGNANLFLMNPAGFLFGPNATVNVGGMVSFSSADYLKFGDGKFFTALPGSSDALLSTMPVAAYGFLGSNPGAITIQGSQLSVTPGQSLSLIGGSITIQSGTLDSGKVQAAQLSAPGGQINLASVASPGEILAGNMAQAPNINGQSFGNLGAIQITKQSVIDVSGNGGGTVLIRGGSFLLDNSTILAQVNGPGPIVNQVELIGGGVNIEVSHDAAIQNAAVIDTSVMGNATPGVTYGGTHVKGASVELVDAAILSNVSDGSTGGNSGNITLEGDSILVKDSGTFLQLLQADTSGAGNSGNISVSSNGDLLIDNGTILTHPLASGNAGNINLTSIHGNISMVDTSHTAGAFIQSEALANSSGQVGSITVSAPAGDILMTDFAQLSTRINGTGNNTGHGGIQFTANNLTMLGGSTAIAIDNFTAFPSGNINVNLTGRLTMSNLTNPDAPNLISTTTRGVAQAAALSITAHDIALSGNSRLSSQTVVTSNPGSGIGNGGPLNISTQTLQLTEGAQITSGTVRGRLGIPSGNGGTVTIHGLSGPADSVLIDSAGSGFFTPFQSPGVGSGIFTDTQGTGAGGNINILANTVTLQNGGILSALTSSTAPGAGHGGTILVQANTVNVTTGGHMTASSTGTGAAGEVTVEGLASPAQSVILDGIGSGIFSETHSTGAGGNILVNANNVALQNAGSLSAATSGTSSSATGGTITVNADQVAVNSGGLITAATTGPGAGGSVNINSGNTFSSNAGTVSSTTTGVANGGNINVAAGSSVTLTNGATISASSTGQGSAGDIHINAGNFTATNSSVTTEATQSTGGIIKITTSPAGTVQLTDSKISASVLDGSGGGGSVNIDPQFVILENSQIIANSVFGPGGNINITTNLLLPDTASIISASSQFGQQGSIVIQSPISPASGKILPLGQKPLLATTLLSQRCAALAGGNASSFTVAGRDSLPAEPGGWISSPLALSMAESTEGTATETAFSSFSEAAVETPLLSLRKIAPPGFLTQSFAVDSSDCQS